jgi:protein-S-isoprenylcysteine O-methyltransferase Ste14
LGGEDRGYGITFVPEVIVYKLFFNLTPIKKEVIMKPVVESFLKIALLVFIWITWWLVLKASLSNAINLSVIVGGVLLTYPLVWLGRKILDRHQTIEGAVWTTTFVHFGLGFTFGVPIVRAVSTYQDWSGWVLPVPSIIGLVLVIISGAAFLLTVVNLALKGLGAPFYIALSRKLAADWLYAWTRNPMALAGLALFLSLGFWFQSALFLLWVLIVLAPAFVFFAKVYEERELEIRFGASYLEYKSRTPMFFPRKPKN